MVHNYPQLASGAPVLRVHHRPGQALGEQPDALRADPPDHRDIAAQRLRDGTRDALGGASGVPGKGADKVADVTELSDQLQSARDSAQVPGSRWALGEALTHPGLRSRLRRLPGGGPTQDTACRDPVPGKRGRDHHFEGIGRETREPFQIVSAPVLLDARADRALAIPRQTPPRALADLLSLCSLNRHAGHGRRGRTENIASSQTPNATGLLSNENLAIGSAPTTI